MLEPSDLDKFEDGAVITPELLKEMGLGCVNSWGALPEQAYMLPYGDYEFTFIMTPISNSMTIE